MGTEEYSDFDSDSDIGDYDARDAGTEETPKSPKPDEKEIDLVVDGKLHIDMIWEEFDMFVITQDL